MKETLCCTILFLVFGCAEKNVDTAKEELVVIEPQSLSKNRSLNTIEYDTNIPLFRIDTSVLFISSTLSDSFNTIQSECPYTIENAKKDIENKSLKLVIRCGFTGCPNSDSIKKRQFQIEYDVNFEYLGCVRGWNIENEDTYGYNETIFKFLTEKYGKQVMSDYENIWFNND